jgi:hypothetical protein
MTIYRYQKQEQYDSNLIKRIEERLDITDYMKTFVRNYNKKYGVKLKTGYLGGAEYLKGLLNASQDKVVPYLEKLEGLFYWNTQKVDFVPSNLQRGYIFYFICTYCDRKVKYLFRHKTYEQPACRICCDIGYAPTQSRRQTRNLSRLIHKKYLHSEDKYMLAKYAGITKEDLPTETEDKNSTRIANELPEETNSSEPSEPRQYEKKMSLDRTAQPPKQAMAQIIYKKMPINLECMEI